MPNSQHECGEQKLSGTACTYIKEIRTPAGFLHLDTATPSGGEQGEGAPEPPPTLELVTLHLKITDIPRIPYGVFPD